MHLVFYVISLVFSLKNEPISYVLMGVGLSKAKLIETHICSSERLSQHGQLDIYSSMTTEQTSRAS